MGFTELLRIINSKDSYTGKCSYRLWSKETSNKTDHPKIGVNGLEFYAGS